MPTLSSKNAQNSKKIAVFCIFFEKYLVMSKKSSTFALAFEKEVRHSKNGAVVQLVRIHACHAWGREFESRPHRREEAEMLLLFFAGLAELVELVGLVQVAELAELARIVPEHTTKAAITCSLCSVSMQPAHALFAKRFTPSPLYST